MIGLLILGIGNLLLSDEGVGVHVTRCLLAEGLPEGTRVVDGGTLGLELLPLLAEAASLLIVDAVDLGAEPGTCSLIDSKELESVLSLHVSPHQVGAADLISLARLLGRLPLRTALLGIQPASLSPGTQLSPSVAAALPNALHLARREAWRLTRQVAHA